MGSAAHVEAGSRADSAPALAAVRTSGSDGAPGGGDGPPPDEVAASVLAAERRVARRKLPPPRPVVGQMALALMEVEAGARSPAQLERRCTPELWEVLRPQLQVNPGRAPVLAMRTLINVHCQEVEPGLAHGVALVRRGDRVTAVVVRIEARKDRWVVTDLRMLIPVAGHVPPLPEPPEQAPCPG